MAKVCIEQRISATISAVNYFIIKLHQSTDIDKCAFLKWLFYAHNDSKLLGSGIFTGISLTDNFDRHPRSRKQILLTERFSDGKFMH